MNKDELIAAAKTELINTIKAELLAAGGRHRSVLPRMIPCFKA